jgi:hypothetical protein
MKKSTHHTPRKRATEIGTFVGVRLQAEPLKRLDDWRRKQLDVPGRAEAIRRLMELGLKSKERE